MNASFHLTMTSFLILGGILYAPTIQPLIGECVPMQEWQTTSFPNCNTFHELDFFTKTVTNQFEFDTSGGYNNIFYLDEKDKPGDPELAIKILIYGECEVLFHCPAETPLLKFNDITGTARN